MNFYASRGFLETAAAVYFPQRKTAIEDVRIGKDVLRLLVVDDKTPVTRLLFLDFHQPLATKEIRKPQRQARYAAKVSRGAMPIAEWDEALYPGQELAPFVDWSKFKNFAEFRDSLFARHRGLMRDRERRGRALEAQHGELVFTLNDERADVLEAARQWKGTQLREIGFPDYFDDPRTMAFLQALQTRGLLVSSTLRAGGRLVSLWIGFIHEGSWSGWIFAYDPAFKKFSPGHQLLIRMLEESCRLGHREFDFSGCAQDYKLLYATHGRLIGDIGTPSPLRAALLATRALLRRHAPCLFAAALRLKDGLSIMLQYWTLSPKRPQEGETRWTIPLPPDWNRQGSTAPNRPTSHQQA